MAESNTRMPLDKQVAVVTGAGRGIGRAIAFSLARRGCTVVAVARTKAQLDSLGEAIAAGGVGSCHVLTADVTREADVRGVVVYAARKLGAVDILVNNAGSGTLGPLVDTTLENWSTALEVNATGVFLFTREVAKLMLGRGGRIVNISSIAGRRPVSGGAAYTASKFAAVGFSAAAARELKPHDIRVYSLCPGAVDTELRRSAGVDENTAKMMKPEDIAELVAFLVGGGGTGLRDLVLEIS